MQWETLATTKLCGETYSYAEYISHDKWPMATDCCVSLDWYVWNGATYTFAATHDNFFTTP